MGVFERIMSATSAGLSAFRKAMLHSDAVTDDPEFGAYLNRLVRYNHLWGNYQNDCYDSVHRYAESMKISLKLPTNIRSIRNPTCALVDFYVSHLMGGKYDDKCGDGTTVPSSLPVITDNDSLRPSIAKVWKDSQWQVKKGVYSRWGAALGDVALRVVDMPPEEKNGYMTKGLVKLEPIHPGELKFIRYDRDRNITAYVLEKWINDPRDVYANALNPNASNFYKPAKYTEIAIEEDGGVKYETFINLTPYDYGRGASAWWEPYPFVPLYLCQHIDVGGDWGWSAIHTSLPKVRNADATASKLYDHIQRKSEGAFILKGIKAGQVARVQNDEDGGDTINMFTGPLNCGVESLVMDLDIPGALDALSQAIADIESNHPELSYNRIESTGADTSGRALNIARDTASRRVEESRIPYDYCLVKATQGAMVIGTLRGYEGYENIKEAYAGSPGLEFTIGDRPVFKPTAQDKLADEALFWSTAQSAVLAGCPLRVFLANAGWASDRIDDVVSAKEEDMATELEMIAKQVPATPKVDAVDPRQSNSAVQPKKG